VPAVKIGYIQISLANVLQAGHWIPILMGSSVVPATRLFSQVKKLPHSTRRRLALGLKANVMLVRRMVPNLPEEELADVKP
jgi:hypothetical protein